MQTGWLLYGGWQFAGIVVVGAIVSIAWLAYAVRHERRVFVPTIIAQSRRADRAAGSPAGPRA